MIQYTQRSGRMAITTGFHPINTPIEENNMDRDTKKDMKRFEVQIDQSDFRCGKLGEWHRTSVICQILEKEKPGYLVVIAEDAISFIDKNDTSVIYNFGQFDNTKKWLRNVREHLRTLCDPTHGVTLHFHNGSVSIKHIGTPDVGIRRHDRPQLTLNHGTLVVVCKDYDCEKIVLEIDRKRWEATCKTYGDKEPICNARAEGHDCECRNCCKGDQ